jgi:hypothetical protein
MPGAELGKCLEIAEKIQKLLETEKIPSFSDQDLAAQIISILSIEIKFLDEAG